MSGARASTAAASAAKKPTPSTVLSLSEPAAKSLLRALSDAVDVKAYRLLCQICETAAPQDASSLTAGDYGQLYLLLKVAGLGQQTGLASPLLKSIFSKTQPYNDAWLSICNDIFAAGFANIDGDDDDALMKFIAGPPQATASGDAVFGQKSSEVQLSDDNQVAKFGTSSGTYAMVSGVTMDTGVWEWDFECVEESPNNEISVIGVGKRSLTNGNYDSSSDMWVLRCYTGQTHNCGSESHTGRVGSRPLTKVHPGDKATFTYDAAAQTLSFKVSDTDHGVIIKDIDPAGDIVPIVGIYGSGNPRPVWRVSRIVCLTAVATVAPDDKERDPVEFYATPDLSMALELTQRILDASSTGAVDPIILGAVEKLTRITHKLPTQLLKTVLIIVAKLFNTIDERTEAPSPTLAAIGEHLISLLESATSKLFSASKKGPPSQLYQAIAQAGVVAAGKLGLSVFKPESSPASNPDLPGALTLESAHPYNDNSDTFTPVEIPGAVGYEVTFSETTVTEANYDFVRFYKDDAHGSYWGEDKYTGGRGGSTKNYPSTEGRPSLSIPASRFVLHFHSDGSGNDFGYVVTVDPIFPGVISAAERKGRESIEALERFNNSLRVLAANVGTSFAVIDSSLLQFIDATMTTTFSRLAPKEFMGKTWAELASYSNGFVQYPALAALVSKVTIASSDEELSSEGTEGTLGKGTVLAEFDPMSILSDAERGAVQPLIELDEGSHSLEAVVGAFVATGKNVDLAAALLLEGGPIPPLPHPRAAVSTDAALGSTSAPRCGKCRCPIDPNPQYKFSSGWGCDCATHTGEIFGFSDTSPQYGCATMLACDWGVCYACWARIGLPFSDPVESRSLQNVQSNEILAARFALIMQLNNDLNKCLDIIDLSQLDQKGTIANNLAMCRRYVLTATKQDIINSGFTASEGSGSQFELVLSRSRAMKFANRGECDNEGRWSVFGQAFRAVHGLPSSTLRRKDQLWTVVFAGERSHDAGGPYRESWSTMCQELMSPSVPLLKPCPNATSIVGINRETWVLNPDATSADQIEMFKFLGKLMGIAARSQQYLDLNLAPIVWKLIVNEIVTLEDFKGIDAIGASFIEKMRAGLEEDKFSEATFAADYGWMNFTTTTLGGTEVELHPGGESETLTWENRLRYCDEREQFHLSEMHTVADAILTGIRTQVPGTVLSLLRGDELERMVCGKAEVDIELLRSATDYTGYSSSDAPITLLWETLRDFSHEDRRAFLKFTWGRSRLPLTLAGFRQRMKVARQDRANPDASLPISHTCFFQLDLPSYTNKASMREKLMYAIYNCTAIDGDDTGVGMRAAAMGMEDDF